MLRGIYTAISLASMLSEYVRAATWRRVVCALAKRPTEPLLAELKAQADLKLSLLGSIPPRSP